MRILLAAAAIGVAVVMAPDLESIAQTGRSSDSLERTFAGGGRVRMDLSAGEYRVEGSADDGLRIEWSVKDPDELWRVKTKADVKGSLATVETDGPDHRGIHAVVRVPARSDLEIRLSAGELTIEGVEGHKDIELRAGEVRIDVGRPADYQSVEASVWAGEINAPAFSGNKSGLFRTFEWSGSGTYRLKVALWAGEVHLRSTDAAARR